jgi:FkbM family methyltransferase
MLNRLFKSVRSATAPAPSPASAAAAQPQAGPQSQTQAAILNLAADPGLRLIDPGIAAGYCAMVNSSQGLFIINRNDTGVGWQLATYNAYMPDEMAQMEALVRAAPADPVVLDIGANIGVVAVCLARAAGPEGTVHSFEAQRAMFHMLAGNAVLNGMDNLHCHYLAVGQAAGSARIPRLDYRSQGSFGSLELNREQQSDLGQQAAGGQFDEVAMRSIDEMAFARVDVVKIDVEGMEAEVIRGARRTLLAHRPLMYVEYLKSGGEALWRLLDELDYEVYDARDNFICFPKGDARAARLMGSVPPWRPPAAGAGA